MKTASFKGKSYERLAYLSDTYGPRMWGSPILEMAIEEVRKMAVTEGFDNVRLEPVANFTRWIRKN
jgi:carboxypeptidase Q